MRNLRQVCKCKQRNETVPEGVLLRQVHEHQVLHILKEVRVLHDVLDVNVTVLLGFPHFPVQVGHLDDQCAGAEDECTRVVLRQARQRGVAGINLVCGMKVIMCSCSERYFKRLHFTNSIR